MVGTKREVKMITQNIVRLVFAVLALFSTLDRINVSSDAKVVTIGQLGVSKHSSSLSRDKRLENILEIRGGEAIVLKKNSKVYYAKESYTFPHVNMCIYYT